MRQEQFIAARRGLPGEVASRRGRAVPGLLVGVLLVAGLIGGGSLAWLSASGTLALGTVSAGDLRVSVGAIARWQATVAFPPSLNPIGVYVNQADVRGTAEDGSTSWARALFRASL
ncbi:MAG: hypothetical protein FWC46_07125, partial [Actinomycetia bacterium]|nr:hypothetical protein [Actinomycetes bacterium]